MKDDEFSRAEEGSEPRRQTWSELLDQIDDLVAEASTTADPDLQRRALQQALKIACKFLTRLNRRVDAFVRRALESAGQDPERSSVPLRDLASAHPELEVFRNADTLIEFLNSTSDLLEGQGYLNRKKLDELKKETADRYEQMLEEKLGLDEFTERFAMIRRLICRPPEDPGGGPAGGPGDPPDGGSPESTGQRVSRIIQTLGALATIGGLAGALILGTPDEQQRPEQPPEEVPHEIKLLVVLLLSALASWLNERGMIPSESVEKTLSPTTAAPTEEKALAHA